MKGKQNQNASGFSARKVLCAVLTVPLMLGTAGCASKSTIESNRVGLNQTISPTSKWYSSFIYGGIDSSLQVDAKDDFFTFANKDWLINTQITEKHEYASSSDEGQKRIDQRLESIIRGQVEENTGTHPAGLSKEQAEHARGLVVKMADFAGNWDTRNELGAEPLRPYIEEIEKISSLEELDSYLCSKEAKKLAPFALMSVFSNPTAMDKTTNYVNIGQINDRKSAVSAKTTLSSYASYFNMSKEDLLAVDQVRNAMNSILGRLGYSEDQIHHLTTQGFSLETKLSEIYMNAVDASKLTAEEQAQAAENKVSLNELKEMQGRYPLVQFLESYGLAQTDQYNVEYPKAVEEIGKLYSDANLESMKAYLIMTTISQSAPLLDRDLFDRNETISNVENKDKIENTSNWDDETLILMTKFINKYVSEPLTQVYISQYCNEEGKQMITEIAEQISKEYKEMLSQSEWLSQETRQKAIEKLDNMVVRSLYPDTFTDYGSLSFDQAQNLVDAVAAVNLFAAKEAGDKAGSAVDRAAWNSKTGMPTTVVNAFYMPNENALNILDGFKTANWNASMGYEETLASLGMVIGHEISHGFDTTGSKYDKEGLPTDWWTKEDRQVFEERSDTLANYFDNLIPLPGEEYYDGQQVKDEAIADMGAVRCLLNIANKTDGFDYKKFFTAYAGFWKNKSSYDKIYSILKDEHPLPYLRVNCVLQQMPEFYETYGITEKDGMYLAPEKRVAVW